MRIPSVASSMWLYHNWMLQGIPSVAGGNDVKIVALRTEQH